MTAPAVDERRDVIAGGTCPACGVRFDDAKTRNLHYMRRHVDRRGGIDR